MWECGLKHSTGRIYLFRGRSLLMWECGLKLTEMALSIKPPVTPYVGVWIETTFVKGLPDRLIVTPYVGVWIETKRIGRYIPAPIVTPYVGVWIET